MNNSTQTSISIVLCTYNNSASLKNTLIEISKCKTIANVKYELICVDNNSTDNTAEVVSFVKQLFSIDFQYIFEGQQGLSHARNRGLEASSGEYILFTDDDAQIPENWLIEYTNLILSEHPECLFSRISVIWHKPKPWWYIKQYQPFFVHLDYGSEILHIKDYEHEFFGKNFCVTKSFLKSLGGFNSKLGRSGSRLVAGEETLIYRKLISNGENVMYFPNAIVGHRLKDREYETTNIRNLFIGSAISKYYLSRLSDGRKIFERPIYPLRYSIGSLISSLFGLIWNAITFNRARCLGHLLSAERAIRIIILWLRNPK